MSNLNNQNKNIIVVIFTEFIRIKDALAWSAISFIGYILGLSTLSIRNNYISLIVFIISTFCITSFYFSMNNYFDVDTDEKNPRRMHSNAIASGKISKKMGLIINLLLVIIPLVITFFYAVEVFLFCAFLLFLGWAYSAPPLRTKGRPVIDVIWHFLGFFSLVIWGSIVAGSVGLLNLLIAISLGVWSCVGQVVNHISDYSYDKKSEIKTFAVWTGLNNAKIVVKIITLLHLILLIPLVLFYTLSYTITLIIAINLPIVGFIVLRPKKGAFPTRRCYTYYLTIVIGGTVYLSCLVYKIYFLLGNSTLGLFNSIGIP